MNQWQRRGRSLAQQRRSGWRDLAGLVMEVRECVHLTSKHRQECLCHKNLIAQPGAAAVHDLFYQHLHSQGRLCHTIFAAPRTRKATLISQRGPGDFNEATTYFQRRNR